MNSIKYPAWACQQCQQILLIALPGLPEPTVTEFVEKVIFHDERCPQRGGHVDGDLPSVQ